MVVLQAILLPDAAVAAEQAVVITRHSGRSEQQADAAGDDGQGADTGPEQPVPATA